MVPDQGRSGRTPQDDGNRTVRDEGLENRLRQLDAKLSKRQTVEREREAARSGKNTGWGNALRLSSEFIAAVIVGAALGWVLDKWAGTSPWGSSAGATYTTFPSRISKRVSGATRRSSTPSGSRGWEDEPSVPESAMGRG